MAKLTEEQKIARNKKRENGKKKKLEEQQIASKNHEKERFISKLLLSKEIKPNRFFEVGEEVEAFHANWENVVVIEKIESGFGYEVSYVSTKENYGNPFKENKTTFVEWFHLRKINKKRNEDDFHKRNILKRFDFFQSSIDSLVNKVFFSGVDFSPSYQRDLVWELSDKELLIESIFHGRDIGKFVFCFLGYDSPKTYEILDGKQRLSTIIEFVTDQFPYKGVYYSDLSRRDLNAFDNLLVGFAESNGSLTLKEKYECFLTLNTAGRPQSQEHLDYVKKLLKEEEEK